MQNKKVKGCYFLRFQQGSVLHKNNDHSFSLIDVDDDSREFQKVLFF